MKRLLFLIFCLSALPSPAWAQGSANSGSITGTVISEPGSHPLKKVIVQIVAEDQRENGNRSARTDTDGHFEIKDVPPGRYLLFLEHTGFTDVNARGQRTDVNIVTVEAGKPVENLLLHMLSAAALTGRVTDEDGDPMPEVRVLVQRKLPGKDKHETAGVAVTNDLGEYRLPNLFPGQYWVAALAPPDFRDYEGAQDKPDATSIQETRYLTTFYPGTYDGAQASPVSLKAGDEMPIDLTLIPARTYRVRGLVTGVPAGQKPVVELTSKTGDSIRASHVGADGQFEVRGAAPGTYVLRASSDSDSTTLTAQQEITIVAADVEGVKLTPVPSFSLSGHMRVEGQATNISQYAVNLRQANLAGNSDFFMSMDAYGMNASVDREGNFEWKNVRPGSYVVELIGGDRRQDFFLKSAKIGDRNIDADFSLTGPAVLDLVVSTRGAVIEGVVTDHDENGNNLPVSNATVVAVPETKYRKLSPAFSRGATDQYGRYAIHGLAPGNYTLYAWQALDEEVYRDPDFLQAQEANGKAIKAVEGSRQTVDLKLSAVGDEWR
jgi:Carboxypeptidase regulatory-like domain